IVEGGEEVEKENMYTVFEGCLFKRETANGLPTRHVGWEIFINDSKRQPLDKLKNIKHVSCGFLNQNSFQSLIFC
ncbi:hypothetical protein, partial [Escherichia coli]|uniref:hypothetical protein n=1 Tax=Escherichia coli TaxID=562 RepID=UPI001ABBD1D2